MNLCVSDLYTTSQYLNVLKSPCSFQFRIFFPEIHPCFSVNIPQHLIFSSHPPSASLPRHAFFRRKTSAGSLRRGRSGRQDRRRYTLPRKTFTLRITEESEALSRRPSLPLRAKESEGGNGPGLDWGRDDTHLWQRCPDRLPPRAAPSHYQAPQLTQTAGETVHFGRRGVNLRVRPRAAGSVWEGRRKRRQAAGGGSSFTRAAVAAAHSAPAARAARSRSLPAADAAAFAPHAPPAQLLGPLACPPARSLPPTTSRRSGSRCQFLTPSPSRFWARPAAAALLSRFRLRLPLAAGASPPAAVAERLEGLGARRAWEKGSWRRRRPQFVTPAARSL